MPMAISKWHSSVHVLCSCKFAPVFIYASCLEIIFLPPSCIFHILEDIYFPIYNFFVEKILARKISWINNSSYYSLIITTKERIWG